MIGLGEIKMVLWEERLSETPVLFRMEFKWDLII